MTKWNKPTSHSFEVTLLCMYNNVRTHICMYVHVCKYIHLNGIRTYHQGLFHRSATKKKNQKVEILHMKNNVNNASDSSI